MHISRLFRNILLLAVLTLQPLFGSSVDNMVTNALEKFKSSIQNLDTEMKKIAVYNITTNEQKKIDVISVQDRMVDILLEHSKFQVVDRTSLEVLLKEQSLSLTGMVSNSEMVKAGQLIGVEGFFFGNMNVNKDHVVFTIKLIDVASSALIYSKTIIGEAYNRVEIGLSAGFSSGTKFDADYSYFDEAADVHKFLRAKSIKDKEISGPQFKLFYIQGFNNVPNYKVGLSLGYIYIDELVHLKETLLVNSGFTTVGFTSYTSLSKFSLDPALIIMPNAIGINTKLFAINIGASVNFFNLNMQLDSWGGDGSGESNEQALTTIKVFPEIGLDVRPVNFLRIFVQAVYVPSDVTFSDEIKLGGVWQSVTMDNIVIQKGLVLNLGLGLSYTF